MSTDNLIKNVGFIGNYLNASFISKEYNVCNLPVEDYVTTIKENDINLVFIDCNIYEEDHEWYNKSFKDLLSLLNLLDIKIICISFDKEVIEDSMKGYFHIHIDPNIKEVKIEKHSIKIPILFNEDKVNPIKSSSKYDVIYYSAGEIIFNEDFKDFHSKKKVKKFEMKKNHINKEFILKILSLIKKSKVLFIKESNNNNEMFLAQLEVVAAFYNTVVIYEGERKPNLSYAIQSEDQEANIYYLRAIIDNTLYREKFTVKRNRKAFLNNTLLFKSSLHSILNKNEIESNLVIQNENAKISVVVSTKRKETLANLFEAINKQLYVDLQIVLLTHGFKLSEKEKRELETIANFEFTIVEVPEEVLFGNCLNASLNYIKHNYVIKIDDDDYYFPNFIIDLWIGLKYSCKTVVGKYAHFFYLEDDNLVGLRREKYQYREIPEVKGNTLLCKTDTFKKYKFSNLSRHVDTDFLQRILEDKGTVFCIHPYDMCVYRGAEKTKHTYQVNDSRFLRDAQVLYYGIPNYTVSSE